MATRKKTEETPVTQTTGEMVVEVPLSQIDASFDNQRTGDWTQGDSKESPNGNSYTELKVSIRETGQKEPVLLRPWSGAKGKKYQLVAGHRRLHAIGALVKDGQAKPVIKAIIREMNDLQAFEAHVLENTARDDLTGPDLAFAAYNLQAKYLEAGTTLSGNAIAARMGKNQSYISTLLRIVGGAPKVAKLWREAPIQLSVNEMAKIAKLKDPNLQMQEYERLLSKAGKAAGSGSGGKDWVASASDRVSKQAAFIGALERDGFISVVNIDWNEPETLKALGITLKADATADQRRTIGKAAKEAFKEAKKAQTADEKEAAEAAEA